MSNTDTIFGQATAIGRGAIAIIRLSGDQSYSIMCNMAKKSFLPKISITDLYDEEGLIDQALLLYFPINNSYTGII